jgi:hypothetical protein
MPLVKRASVVFRPVTGVSPSTLVLAWRAADERPLLTALRRAVREVVSR